MGSDGLDLTAIKCEGEHFATYGLDFLGHGAGKPVDVLGDGFSSLQSGVEGVAVEPEAAGEVGAEVSEVNGGVDPGVEGGPGVVL